MGHRIHPGGTPAQYRDGDVPLLGLLPAVHLQPADEWHNLGAHLPGPQAAYPNVLLPFTPGNP